MAPNESPQNKQVPLLQFIIALLLVKSKPSTLSSTDFRRQMASNVKEGRRSRRSTQADTHNDTVALWRNRATRLEEQKTAMEEENAALKEQSIALEAEVSQFQARVSELERREGVWMQKSAELEDSAGSRRLKRRKGRGSDEEVSGTSTKRARTKLGERDAVLPDPTIDETGTEWDELGNNLLESLSNLRGSSIARLADLLGPKDLADRLSTIATDICSHVSEVNFPTNLPDVTSSGRLAITSTAKQQMATYPQTEPEDIMEQRLGIIGRTFPHFLFHLHTLSQFSETGNLCGRVIYRFIDIFRVLFQRICDLAVITARSDQHRPKTMENGHYGPRPQSATSSSDDRPAQPPIIMKLCKLVITLLLQLDPIKSTHKNILEGCLYHLLTRIGKVLENFTIGGRPFGIQHDLNSMSTAASDTEAFEAQAPYLIWMLSCTQRFSPSLSSATNVIDARIQLQNTLVKAVFGQQASSSFEPALKPPQLPADDELMTEFDTLTETTDVRGWFKSEVWRLVGWDVLRDKTA